MINTGTSLYMFTISNKWETRINTRAPDGANNRAILYTCDLAMFIHFPLKLLAIKVPDALTASLVRISIKYSGVGVCDGHRTQANLMFQ